MPGIPKLAGLAEIAALAGKSRTRAGQLAAHPDFPEPVQRLAMGPVWIEADVLKFLATPRKAGRKTIAKPSAVTVGGIPIKIIADERMSPGVAALMAPDHDGKLQVRTFPVGANQPGETVS